MQRLQKPNIIRWLHFCPTFSGFNTTTLSSETVNSTFHSHSSVALFTHSVPIEKCLTNSPLSFTVDSTKCRILRQLVSYCENELYEIDLCSECYCNANEHPDDWFTMVCEHPHILVWAKCDDIYWPAKAMALTTISNVTQIYVRYFGGHRRFAYIGPNDCYLYSNIHPEGLHFEEIDSIHEHAISVSTHLNGYYLVRAIFINWTIFIKFRRR